MLQFVFRLVHRLERWRFHPDRPDPMQGFTFEPDTGNRTPLQGLRRISSFRWILRLPDRSGCGCFRICVRRCWASCPAWNRFFKRRGCSRRRRHSSLRLWIQSELMFGFKIGLVGVFRLLPEMRSYFYVRLLCGTARITPTSCAVTWNRTHVSSAASLLRYLFLGLFTDWATCLVGLS